MTESVPLFSLADRIAIVTGGYGVLGGSMADALAAAGATVGILGRDGAKAQRKADEISARGERAFAVTADVLNEASLRAAARATVEAYGRVDILLNAAGGNVARARTDGQMPFAMPFDAFDEVLRLNLHGTVMPSLIFGEAMATAKRGVIINISSMASTQALSGVMGYSAAKAAIDNFTRWLAVDVAQQCGDGIRVNAISPGFFLSTQNRAVLIQPDGSYSARAQRIVAKTPMKRFGEPHELHGALLFLCSDAASFVTGVVIPVDGGFSAFSGV